MIIILRHGATKADADALLAQIAGQGLQPLYLPGTERIVLGAIGDERVLGRLHLESHPQVESVKPILTPYKQVSRELHPEDRMVTVGNVPIGGVLRLPMLIRSPEEYQKAAAIMAPYLSALSIRMSTMAGPLNFPD